MGAVIHAVHSWAAPLMNNPTPSGVIVLCAATAVVGFVLGFLAAIPLFGSLIWGLRR
jgi:type III secretory pathway component EscT